MGNSINPRLILDYGKEQIQKGDFDKAIQAFDKFIAFNPELTDGWFHKGLALGNLGTHYDAIKCFDKVIDINPSNADAWCNKGVALGSIGKYVEAVECFGKALNINPNLADAWYNNGVILSRLNKIDEALQSYDKTISITPDNQKAWSNKGTVFLRLEKYKEAIECYNKALDVNPNSTEILSNKGDILEKMGQNLEALESFNRAIHKDNKCGNAWYNKGTVLAKLRKFPEALECYDAVLEINPTAYKALINKGAILIKINKHDSALECFNNALDIDNYSPLGWAYKGMALHGLKNFYEAIICYNNAIEKDSSLGEALANKGITLLAIHDYNKAIDAFQEAGRIFLKKNDINKADLASKYESSVQKFIQVKIEIEDITGHPYFELSPSVPGMETKKDLLPILIPDIGNNESVKISLVSLDYNLTDTFPYQLKDAKNIKNKIIDAIDIAQNNNVNLICFPELSFTEEVVQDITMSKKYAKIIIIGGSYYDANCYNVCPVLINGNEYRLRKINPSPNLETEIIAGKKMNCGNEIMIFETKDKKISFSVLICMDYILQSEELCQRKINLIFNPSCNSDPHRFQKKADVNCENYQVDTFMANVIKHGNKFGGTCVIGSEHKDNIQRLKAAGIRTDDGIDYKLCEIDSESMIIVDVSSHKIAIPTPADATPRFKFIAKYEYSSNTGNWERKDF